MRGPPERRFYEVWWKGYPQIDTTWEPMRFFKGTGEEAIEDFWAAHHHLNKESTIEVVGEHRCPWCNKFFPYFKTGEKTRFFKTAGALKSHLTKARGKGGCDSKPASQSDTLAEKAAIRAKRKDKQKERDKVSYGSVDVQAVLSFSYLGTNLQADGDMSYDVKVRMAMAKTRFGKMHEVWADKQLSLKVKLRLYESAVWSILMHGCIVWRLDAKTKGSLRNWNARCLTKITGRDIRSEHMDPTEGLDLVRKIQSKRLSWMGRVLRLPDDRLLKQVMIKSITAGVSSSVRFPEGSIFYEARASSMKELMQRVNHVGGWDWYVKKGIVP